MDGDSESIVENRLLTGNLSSQNLYRLFENQNCTLEDFGVIIDHTVSDLTTLHYDDSIKSHSPIAPKFVFNHYTKFEDMQYWVAAAIVLILVRRLVERNIFDPFGKILGIKEPANHQTCRIPSAVPSLEAVYLSRKKNIPGEIIGKLCLVTGLNAREIERWFRKRRIVDRPSTLTKFSESGWRFVCYVMSTGVGIWTLWDKPWFWNVEICWLNYPDHNVSMDMWLYYLYGSGLYLSFLITQAFDVKRKDFWEMFVHHIITIALLTISWTLNQTRMGIYTLFLHDCADVFLESAKMANYAKKQDLSTGIFVIFTLVWVVTRLIIYPRNVVMVASRNLLSNQSLPRYVSYLLITLISVLFCLHVFWTYFICKVAVSTLQSENKIQKDARSSTESDSSDEDKVQTSPSLEPKQLLTLNQEKTTQKRFSLPFEDGAQLLAMINSKQRLIMKRISIEIM